MNPEELIKSIHSQIEPLEIKIERSIRDHWNKIREWVKTASKEDWEKRFADDIKKYGSMYVKEYYNSHEYFIRSRGLIAHDDLYKEHLDKEVKMNLLKNREKIEKAVLKLSKKFEIKEFSSVILNVGHQGIEGEWKMILEDGTTKEVRFESIVAGGYNIQILHLRYLCKVSK